MTQQGLWNIATQRMNVGTQRGTANGRKVTQSENTKPCMWISFSVVG